MTIQTIYNFISSIVWSELTNVTNSKQDICNGYVTEGANCGDDECKCRGEETNVIYCIYKRAIRSNVTNM